MKLCVCVVLYILIYIYISTYRCICCSTFKGNMMYIVYLYTQVVCKGI